LLSLCVFKISSLGDDEDESGKTESKESSGLEKRDKGGQTIKKTITHNRPVEKIGGEGSANREYAKVGGRRGVTARNNRSV